MTETTFARVRRLLSAQIADVVDAMERANSDATMREAVREVDRLIDELRTGQNAVMVRRLQATRQQTMIAQAVEDLTVKARFALREGREDLAEIALSRQLDLESEASRLKQVQADAQGDEARFEESLCALRTRKKQMEEALVAYGIARADAVSGDGVSLGNGRDIERKLESAEAAFDRAMSSAGGIGVKRGETGAIKALAEIETMQRRATIADRLAMLRSEEPAGGSLS